MNAQAAAAAAAHRRVKRAMGLLRAAATALAPEASELDVAGEIHLEPGEDPERVLELLRLIRHRHHGPIDVVILAAPAPPRPSTAADSHRGERQLA
jgi:hypothetical protein